MGRRLLGGIVTAMVAAACAPVAGTPDAAPGGVRAPEATGTTAATEVAARIAGRDRPAAAAPELVPGPDPLPEPLRRPAWLGARILPPGPGGYGAVLPTPSILRDRRLPPPTNRLPDPPDDAFVATIATVPAEVAGRSTWHPGCPVGLDELRYITLTYWGFDERPHTGELLVHRDVAEVVVAAFEAAYAERFPIEDMRVVSPADLDAPMTGDGNMTTAFVCRPTRGSSAWSEHARGLAVDVNPFHNPYRKGQVVLPELASAYLDRTDLRPGMLTADSALVRVLESAGWGWGGRWRSLDDWMHLSLSGR